MGKLNREWIVQPHGELVEIDEGLLTVVGTIKMPLGEFPRRMTLVALAGGGSAVWSAIPLDKPAMARIEALGPVRFLIVPNAGHRLDLPAWHARYPDAKVIAPPRGQDSVAEAAPVDATADIVEDPAIAFGLVDGMSADEFFMTVKRNDRVTLILNDILANVRHPKGLGAKIMARLFGFGVDRPRTARLVRRMYVADGKAVARQLRTWADLPGLTRVVVSHGDVIEADPAGALRTAASDFD